MVWYHTFHVFITIYIILVFWDKFPILHVKFVVYIAFIFTSIVPRSRRVVLLSTHTVQFSSAGCCLAYDSPDKSKAASCVSTDDRTAVLRRSRSPKFVLLVHNSFTSDRTAVARRLLFEAWFLDKLKAASCQSTDFRKSVVLESRFPKFVQFMHSSITSYGTVVAVGYCLNYTQQAW